MKKRWIITLTILIAFNAMATNFIDGIQYVTLNTPVIDAPPILEFFSFYCPHCCEFNETYDILGNIKHALRSNTKITRYHVESLGVLSKSLTQAWAVAMTLGIEDKISPLIFQAIQNTKTLNNYNDIRNIFIKAGVSAAHYDAIINSFVVKALVIQQNKAAEELQPLKVPTLIVNGKYMVKNDNLDASSVDIYAQQFTNIVAFLSTKK